ncbi:stress-responsive transcription factor hsf1 [Clydaea vesicula]|uniref:Stress-responsive transcription factor hsf1 n=1 Tax=Clydaea vesicula TaxID=447962 RepID=A0AAD5U3X1_9FUNG|nr:stress-responsive transcription factor hsf1 [Clydaea vesicula]KAJ3391335.1 stress-responsive transcription factor hsf1 [Lobulomyces angularis]
MKNLKFIEKLYSILDSDLHCNCIKWSDTGHSFIITNPEIFQNEVLPLYFSHANLKSFNRQINYHSFQKLSKTKSNYNLIKEDITKEEKEVLKPKEFFNVNFIKGKPELLKNIVRKNSNSSNNLYNKPKKALMSETSLTSSNNTNISTTKPGSYSVSHLSSISDETKNTLHSQPLPASTLPGTFYYPFGSSSTTASESTFTNSTSNTALLITELQTTSNIHLRSQSPNFNSTLSPTKFTSESASLSDTISEHTLINTSNNFLNQQSFTSLNNITQQRQFYSPSSHDLRSFTTKRQSSSDISSFSYSKPAYIRHHRQSSDGMDYSQMYSTFYTRNRQSSADANFSHKPMFNSTNKATSSGDFEFASEESDLFNIINETESSVDLDFSGLNTGISNNQETVSNFEEITSPVVPLEMNLEDFLDSTDQVTTALNNDLTTFHENPSITEFNNNLSNTLVITEGDENSGITQVNNFDFIF